MSRGAAPKAGTHGSAYCACQGSSHPPPHCLSSGPFPSAAPIVEAVAQDGPLRKLLADPPPDPLLVALPLATAAVKTLVIPSERMPATQPSCTAAHHCQGQQCQGWWSRALCWMHHPAGHRPHGCHPACRCKSTALGWPACLGACLAGGVVCQPSQLLSSWSVSLLSCRGCAAMRSHPPRACHANSHALRAYRSWRRDEHIARRQHCVWRLRLQRRRHALPEPYHGGKARWAGLRHLHLMVLVLPHRSPPAASPLSHCWG